MRIEVVKQTFDGNTVYKVKKMEYCCKKLEKNPLIRLMHTYVESAYCNHCEVPDDGKDHCTECMVFEETDAGGMKLSMMIEETDTHPVPWEDYYDTDYRYYPIEYCPHCGNKIEIKVVKEENLDSAYNDLIAERENLQIKARRTNSKRKEASLQEKLSNVDKKINELYKNCGEYR